MRGTLSVLLVLAACSSEAATELAIRGATPGYGPLSGGTRIVVAGTGFVVGASNRVFIDGTEAPLAAALDDTELAVVIPSGAQPGDAEIVVLNDHGNARATGVFRYSSPPTIATVAPANVAFGSASTVTVTGIGFADEGAGSAAVLVDGEPAMNVVASSDTTLTFTAPAGVMLARPDIVVINDRGIARRERAYRYTPAARGGLLLFPAWGGPFAIFFDPVDNSTVTVPQQPTNDVRFTTVVLDDRGDFLGFDRSRRFGRIDMKSQRLAAPVQLQAGLSAITRVDDRYIAIDRFTQRFVTFDPAAGTISPFGNEWVPCCGSFGIAFDGATIYFTARSGGTPKITTLSTAGVTGTPVTLTGGVGFHVEEMRFFDGKLYAASRDGTLVTIDPSTGGVTVLPISMGRFTAMEVLP